MKYLGKVFTEPACGGSAEARANWDRIFGERKVVVPDDDPDGYSGMASKSDPPQPEQVAGSCQWVRPHLRQR